MDDDEIITFSTGLSVKAFHGIVGIAPDLETYYGYDGGLFEYDYTPTKQERIELADLMIARWQAFKDAT